MTRPLLTFLVDAAFVLLFALGGRLSHAEGLTWGGLLETAWPFLVGLTVGWAAARRWRGEWPIDVAHAVPVWLLTVALGLLLRVVTGGGGAPASFVLVAGITLAVFLLGWRCVTALVVFAGEGLTRWSDDLARRRPPPR